jgi:hypothetical protein
VESAARGLAKSPLEAKVHPEYDPVYVYTPAWRGDSAGIRVLHLLCDALNADGCPTWLVISSPDSRASTNPQLNTPVLTQAMADSHIANGLDPILIYSETVPGNPLAARRVLRYLLNFPGALGGMSEFPETETMVAYSGAIADSVGGCPTLFVPAVDLDEIGSLPRTRNTQKLPVVYAAKYRAFRGTPKLSGLSGYVEIQRGRSGQSRAELLNLLRSSPLLYCFENSTIATEAMLLGTPVLFVRSDFFSRVIAEQELGRFGWSWSDESGAEEWAKSSVHQVRRVYEESVASFPERVRQFVGVLDGVRASDLPVRRIHVPKKAVLVSRHRVALGQQAWRNIGWRGSLRLGVDFIRRRLPG